MIQSIPVSTEHGTSSDDQSLKLAEDVMEASSHFMTRLEMTIVENGKIYILDLAKKKGARKSVEYLGKELAGVLPSGLEKVLHSLRTGASWTEQALDTSWCLEGDMPVTPEVLQRFQQHLPTFTKFHGLDSGFLEQTMPDQFEKAKMFQKKFIASLAKWVSDMESDLSSGFGVLDSLRQESCAKSCLSLQEYRDKDIGTTVRCFLFLVVYWAAQSF